MEPLTALIPQGGVAAVLLAVIVYLLRQNHQDRKQYRDDVARIETRAAADAKAAAEKHSAEMLEVNNQIAGLRKEVRDAMAETEEERRKRWHAEDAAASFRRRLEELGQRVEAP